jgi:tRNA(Ile)-lysidine synthase
MTDERFSNGKQGIFVDADTLAPPCSLRLWQPGDTIHPLGFNHTRKVSDVLKDLKLSRYDKRYVWLLVDSAGTIVWIVGLVQNHLFRTTSRTARVLHICLENC